MIDTVIEMNRPDLLPVAKIGIFQRKYHEPFVRVMDQMARDSNKSIWVEKTPRHLHCVDEIIKRIPDAIFIHIVRNGSDVVASLVNATTKNPTQWARFGGRRWKKWKGFTIEDAIKIWNRDFMISKLLIGRPNNTLVKFEDLIENPVSVASRLCNVLGIKLEDEMMNPATSYCQIVRSDEPWKANNSKRIGVRQKLVDEIFTSAERRLIEARLLRYEF